MVFHLSLVQKCQRFLPLWFVGQFEWFGSINNFSKIYKIGDALSILSGQPPSNNLSLFYHNF